MTTERYSSAGRNDKMVRIVECPFCGADIGQGCDLRHHLPCDEVDA